MAERRRPGTTVIAAVLLGALLLVALLLTPTAEDPRGQLTSRSAEPGGARALHDLQRRSGWQVEQRETPFGDSMDTRAVYAVLDPPVMVTALETHRLLEAVRGGAGLLLVVPADGPLADSLGISRSALGGTMDRRDEAPEGFCPDSLNRAGSISWAGGRVQSWWLQSKRAADTVFTRVTTDSGLAAQRRRPTSSAPAASATTTSATTAKSAVDSASVVGAPAPAPAARPSRTRAAMAGYTLGRGRVVAVADPDLLRNDVLRVCRWNAGPTAARALDWLAEVGGERLVFDEYHQNPRVDATPVRAVSRALVKLPWGRMVLAGAFAALVLLAAAGARPIAPAPRPTIERRSPLEHVQALSRAYSQAGATRLVARRLARGLRRRHAVAAPAGGDDAAYLDALAARHPALTPDLQLLARAMAEPVPTDELPAVGDAVARLDSRLRPYR